MSQSLRYDVPLISARYAKRFLAFLKQREISAEALLAETSIEPVQIQNSDSYLSVKQVIEILKQAEWMLSDERAGFLFGQKLDLISHGLFGFVLLQPRNNYRDLVACVVEHLRVALPLIDMKCEFSGGEALISLHPSWELREAYPFLCKVYLGSTHTIASQICHNIRCEFNFPSSLSAEEWSQCAPGTQFLFDQPHCRIILPLKASSCSGEGVVEEGLAISRGKTSNERSADADEKEAPTVAYRVKEHILQLPGKASLELVAGKMSLSPRYLRQQLADEGTSFREIHGEVRCHFARIYLAETPVPLDKIARKLGFSEQASFTRAFRSWTGMTPGDYRRQERLSA